MRGKEPSVAEKYDYLYPPEELETLCETARSLEEEAATVHITFNNNNRGLPSPERPSVSRPPRPVSARSRGAEG
jgi:uncharacterized protein YecE (DUF72 family)